MRFALDVIFLLFYALIIAFLCVFDICFLWRTHFVDCTVVESEMHDPVAVSYTHLTLPTKA